MRALAAAAVWLLLARPAAGDVLLNEILYDPEGADEGAEFVELWNPGDLAVPLLGVSLEAGDGASPGAWTPLWSGTGLDSVPPRSPFLVRGVSLGAGMQNGPDAVRLLRGGAVLDLLGYGPLTLSSMYEGSPAPDAPSGQSLARVADGVDTDANGADWAVEPTPTPGLANHPDFGIVFRSPPLRLEPEVPWPGEAVGAAVRVRSIGRLALADGAWSVLVESPDLAGSPLALAGGPAVSPGESLDVPLSLRAPGARGPLVLRAIARVDGGAAGAAPADTAWIETRVGGGPAVVGEFAFRGPAGEWVEIECVDAIPDAGALALSDRAGRPIAVEGGAGPRPLPAGARVVLAESPGTVRARYALPESLVLGLREGWPSLNDADGADGRADVVRLHGPGGAIWDAVPYVSSYADRGGSVERLAPDLPSAARGTWAESVDPSGGTPGRPNSLRADPGGSVRPGALLAAASHSLLRSGGEVRRPVLLRLTSEASGRRLRIEVRDLRGRTRRVLAGGQRFAGEAALGWDGRDDRGEPVPPGIYTVRAEADAEGGLPARATSLALWVAEEAAR